VIRRFILKFFAPPSRLARFIAGPDEAIRGVAAVEFGLIVSFLAAMTICVADVGMGFYRKMQVQSAAQAGAEYAIVHGYSATSISNAVTAATSMAGISASPAPSEYCGCPSNTAVTAVDCASTCSDGSVPGTYVTVSAQGTYTTLLSYPMIPNSFTFNARASVRIQ
jgi:Flp pilus assembly protein TadG